MAGTFGDDFEYERNRSKDSKAENDELIKDIEEQRAARLKEELEARGEQEDDTIQPLSHERTDAQVGTADDLASDQRAKRLADEDTARQDEEKKAKAKAAKQSDEPDGNSLTIEERLDLMDQELELRDLKLQKMEQKASKWEELAQRRAGEIGHLRQSNSRTPKEEKAELDLWSELLEEEKPEQVRQRSSVTQLSEFEEEAIESARQSVQIQFLNEYASELYTGEGEDRELDPDFVEILKEVRNTYEDDLTSPSPKRVRKATQAVLRDARLTLKERRLESSIAEARKRRVVVSQKAREQKLASQASESSSSSSNQTETRNFEDLSTDEMAEIMRKDKRRSGIY